MNMYSKFAFRNSAETGNLEIDECEKMNSARMNSAGNKSMTFEFCR